MSLTNFDPETFDREEILKMADVKNYAWPADHTNLNVWLGYFTDAFRYYNNQTEVDSVLVNAIAKIIRYLSTPFELRGGAWDIAEERQRQIDKEGWTAEHDEGHANGELALAAAYYARADVVCRVDPNLLWPENWDEKWRKPKGRIRNLVRAGALIAAEIDRLKRLEDKECL